MNAYKLQCAQQIHTVEEKLRTEDVSSASPEGVTTVKVGSHVIKTDSHVTIT